MSAWLATRGPTDTRGFGATRNGCVVSDGLRSPSPLPLPPTGQGLKLDRRAVTETRGGAPLSRLTVEREQASGWQAGGGGKKQERQAHASLISARPPNLTYPTPSRIHVAISSTAVSSQNSCTQRLYLGERRCGAGASRVPFGAPTMAPSPHGSTLGSADHADARAGDSCARQLLSVKPVTHCLKFSLRERAGKRAGQHMQAGRAQERAREAGCRSL
jgi:hypothetical protein